MCYSGKCKFESHGGDCGFPSWIKSIKDKYGYLCHPHLDGEEYTDWYNNACIDVDRMKQDHIKATKLKEEQKINRIRLRQKLQKIKQ